MHNSETTLYRFFDGNGQLIYVGISGAAVIRWSQHRDTKDWWAEVAASSVEHFSTRREALLAEARAIKEERPKYNLVGRPGPRTQGHKLEQQRLLSEEAQILEELFGNPPEPECWYSEPGLAASIGWSQSRLHDATQRLIDKGRIGLSFEPANSKWRSTRIAFAGRLIPVGSGRVHARLASMPAELLSYGDC